MDTLINTIRRILGLDSRPFIEVNGKRTYVDEGDTVELSIGKAPNLCRVCGSGSHVVNGICHKCIGEVDVLKTDIKSLIKLADKSDSSKVWYS